MKKIICTILCGFLAFSATACTNNNSSSAKNTSTAVNATSDTQVIDTDVLEWVDYKEYNLDQNQPVKNVILMIGDGMGENTIKAAEIVKGDKLVMSGLKTSTYVTTDSLDGTTDSAASSTAMSCGIKTHNKFLGVDKDSNAVETLCEFAMAKGMKTGLVVTQIVNHATPAGMVAHCDARSMYNVILKQMITAGVDVMLGGGSQYHTNKISNLLESNGYNYVESENDLLKSSKDKKLLGMFSYQNIIAGKSPSLATMTEKSLELLNNDNGFFLMVEGSDIDVFAAKEDMTATLNEMKSFDKAVDTTLKWAEKNPGTLVIVCADHETGGVKIPENAAASDINDKCFTSGGEHTSTPIKLMAGGAGCKELFGDKSKIDNTDISKGIRKLLNKTYGEKSVILKNDSNQAGIKSDKAA